jgi:hypothetical protein
MWAAPKRRARMVSALLEPSPEGRGGGKVEVEVEVEEEESSSSSSEDLPSNKEGIVKEVEDGEESSSSKDDDDDEEEEEEEEEEEDDDDDDVDLPLTKLRHQKPSADEVNISFNLAI